MFHRKVGSLGTFKNNVLKQKLLSIFTKTKTENIIALYY